MTMSDNIFLGLGSNVGDRLENLKQALRELHDLSETHLIQYSSIYETEPVGVRQQRDFLNMTAEVASELSPQDFLQEIKAIEKGMGRTDKGSWGPRTIDIDILYWAQQVHHTEFLQIPHPEVEKRRFVLQPLTEIAGDFQTPDGISVRDLLSHCPDTGAVECFLERDQVDVEFKMRGEIAT